MGRLAAEAFVFVVAVLVIAVIVLSTFGARLYVVLFGDPQKNKEKK